MSDLHPHRRRNPLTGEWVLVSPHRMLRPWQGQVEKAVPDERPAFDPGCYLCPGNARAGGNQNPDYDGTFVFTNDFSAVLPEGSTEASGDPLFTAEPVRGECRVVCFSPRHDLTLAEMPEAAIGRVIETWQAQIAELGERYAWVQVFENKGAVMGCSNPHPHGQIWALDQMPMLPAREDARQRDYFAAHGSPMLADYAAREIADGARIICAGDSWVALVPYWATWPFEALLLPKRPMQRLTEATPGERADLAAVLKELLCRYDNLFEAIFPYSMGWHGAPFAEDPQDHWQLHAHFYPPLLRSATIKKFMVGFEMLGEPQRDLTAEQAAERLRSVPAKRWR